MSTKSSTFEVDIKGLRALHSGKPIWFVVRELIQNALDENITKCTVKFNYERGYAMIVVEDDNPEGFRDLSDAYTLFKDTYKRGDVTKRGRFNFGEKQVIAMCDYAKIVTTKGSVEFTKEGRRTLRTKRDAGSEVTAKIKMSRTDYASCVGYCTSILVPKNIILEVHLPFSGKSTYGYRQPDHTFIANLRTEILEDGMMRTIKRDAPVTLHKRETVREAYIYEMGIPVCPIECDYDINVGQKIPLNMERDNVDSKFLKDVYAEVLNHVHGEVKEDQSSNSWVRIASSSDRIAGETIKDIFIKRYGDKAVIANPFDQKSIDEAITHGFNVIRSSELNGEEHRNAKKFGALMTSSEKFPVSLTGYTEAEMTPERERIAKFTKKVFNLLSPKKLKVMFIKSDATCFADFGGDGEHYTIRFNLKNIPSKWMEIHKSVKDTSGYKPHLNNGLVETGTNMISMELLDLIIHELAHMNGTHYEKTYLDTITRLGAELTMLALRDYLFFNV